MHYFFMEHHFHLKKELTNYGYSDLDTRQTFSQSEPGKTVTTWKTTAVYVVKDKFKHLSEN